MRIAVPRFPGSNCDQDALAALRDGLGVSAEYVWHETASLAGFDGVFVPGGFTYGDYLRCGAIASRAPIMTEVARVADLGMPVLGVCNGFQILCEAGLLPGALLPNAGEKFLCQDVFMAAEGKGSFWTEGISGVLRIPIAHMEGRYVCDEATLRELEESGRVAFRYVNSDGSHGAGSNPNGSTAAIAGVTNQRGNVLGMMPHPERAFSALLGGADGLAIIRGFERALSRAAA